MSGIYDIAVYILGDLPSYFEFAYIIFTLVLSIAFIICILSPFILVYKWFK